MQIKILACIAGQLLPSVLGWSFLKNQNPLGGVSWGLEALAAMLTNKFVFIIIIAYSEVGQRFRKGKSLFPNSQGNIEPGSEPIQVWFWFEDALFPLRRACAFGHRRALIRPWRPLEEYCSSASPSLIQATRLRWVISLGLGIQWLERAGTILCAQRREPSFSR